VFLIDRGEIVGAVNNFRFNESPFHVLRHATDIGACVAARAREGDWPMPRTAMPPLRVSGFSMSSVTESI
jgi:predicted Zn-dependent protease